MTQKVLITSALMYANGALHFGHIAGCFLPADCYARYRRLKGDQVLYVGGSDEYGVAITFSAEKANRSPKEHIDIFHEVNQGLLKKLNISFDHFSRTSIPDHVKPTQDFFRDLVKNGFVEKQKSEQLYSEKDERFLADRYVEGECPKCHYTQARGDECPSCGGSYEATDLLNPISKVTRAPLIRKLSEHWFLRLDKFSEPLKEWLQSKDWKANVKNFVGAYIDKLKPRAITRDGTWGIPLPDEFHEEGKVFYVWFDAPIGYISASIEWAKKNDQENAWKDFWLDSDTEYAQFMGKDNIFFHALWFPAMIMGQNMPYKQVDKLFANEFYKLEGKQFSKSDGWFIDLESFFLKYTADQIRYAIASNAPESSDSEFTWKDFQSKCNSDLLGKWGNLVNRVFVFATRSCNSAVPHVQDLSDVDTQFMSDLKDLSSGVQEAFEKSQLRLASKLIIEVAQLGNVYFNAKEPWKAAKDPSKKQGMMNTIALCLEGLKKLALLSYPIIPDTSTKVWSMLGFTQAISEKPLNENLSTQIPEGQKINRSEVLFKKMEDSDVQLEIDHLNKMSKKTLQDKSSSNIEALKDMISFDEFQKLDLRVGKVVQAEKVPKSKKLLHLHVDIGLEIRSIVSGIFPSYKPEEILGKKVIVVANLKSAKLMGIESQGMVLAADLDDGLEVIALENANPGQKVS